ncbi:MAG: DUF3100 domain-containing protein [Synergistaceae bacterium]|nr:DUF3100 domain-containing protein [Synergistaceae bacterium]MBR0044569.1 DUF3100 domain-containing protein [Synergistaceae bacterium]MBR0096286.1 DUF3100 domain-containing protein [Synergistaceae bacterium]
MNIVDRALKNWKLHVLALVLTVIAELIGTISFDVGPAKLVMIPLLYAFILGALCGIPALKLLTHDDMVQTSSLVSVTFFFLMARYGTLVGPSFWKVVQSAPALILQEFGNIGTVFFGIPIAVLLGLRREAVGAAFSNAREPNIAIVGEKYGMDTPEGIGVMGVYVTGTVFGALFCSFLSSFIASTMSSFFSPQALAMACGTGSASMMSASLAPLTEMWPDLKDELAALASASNMCSGLDGVYMCVFLSLPISEWLVRLCGVKDAPSRPAGNAEAAAN